MDIIETFEKWDMKNNPDDYFEGRNLKETPEKARIEARRKTWNASRINFAGEIKKKWELKDSKKIPLWILNIINTELKKEK